MPALVKGDTLFAHIALNLVPGLSASARRVGGAIIEHFNRKTGQCDPSVERLASMLEINRATVMRATAELCGEDGLFERVVHGGRSHRTAYLPRWEKFNEIVADWQAQMKTGESASKVAKLRRSRSQDCDVDSRKTATRTLRRNPLNKPKDRSEGKERLGNHPPQSKPKGMSGLGMEGARPDPQRFLMHAVPGGKSGVAHEAAMKRMMREVRATNLELAYRIDCEATPEMMDAAAAAEATSRGSGIPVLIHRLRTARASEAGG